MAMMVMRPPSPVRGAARGISPNRNSPTGNRAHRPLVRSHSDRSLSSAGTGSSKHRNNGSSLPSSRASENGSVDRLDETGNLQRIISSYHNAEDNINVVVKVRPLSQKERKYNNGSVITFPGNGQILFETPNINTNSAHNNNTSSANSSGNGSGHKQQKLFSFNVVFEPAATQADVLEYSGVKRLVEMAVQGFSCTCFCYGQTGSGKTHTLTGPPGLIEKHIGRSEDHGLIVRSFNYLFNVIENYANTNFILKASFLEIYNEKVIDLLNPGSSRKPLLVRWSKKTRGFFVENLFTVECEQLDDLVAVLEEGMRNRSVGRHQMNDHSSRSHTILTVHVLSEQPAENGVFIGKHGKIHFVDLAGSEMTKKTMSEGKTLEEANNINKSLMVLGYCISSLSDSKKRSGHIPYRDSKLTKLLADSLAGNGVTLMIACVSPAKSNLSETLNTLRYAARAKKIRTKPVVVMDPREALIISLKREVSILQTENDRLRSMLHIHGQPATVPSPVLNGDQSNGTNNKRTISPPAAVDLERLAELQAPQLAELVKLYLRENEQLRNENHELFHTRDIVLRDQQTLSRENERLLKKLEDVNSVCCRSPIIPARPTLSAEMLNKTAGSDLDLTSSGVFDDHIVIEKGKGRRLSMKLPNNLPDTIQKELDKRRIGNGDSAISRSNQPVGNRSQTGNRLPDKRITSADFYKMEQNGEQLQKTVENRRNSSPPMTSPLRHHSSVLPDRNEFVGRACPQSSRTHAHQTTIDKNTTEIQLNNALKRLSIAENERGTFPPIKSEPRKTSTGTNSSKNKVQTWLSDNKKHINPLDTSCLSPTQNEVFGSVVSDDDDDDLVYSKNN